MKHFPSSRTALLGMASALLGAAASLEASSFSTDFNSGLPAKSAVYGNAAIAPNAATGGGCLQLTAALANQNGAFVITDDLDAGVPVVSFTATFKLLVGGGARWNFGNGLSFNFAPDVPLGTVAGPENGVGSGVTVGFKTTPYSSSVAPTIFVSGGGWPVEPKAFVDNLRANTLVDTVIKLNPNNTLDVIYDGVYVYSNTPVAYTPIAGSLFWIGGGTDSSFENHFLDNLNIVTRTNYGPFVSSFGPQGRQVQAGSAIGIALSDYNTQVNTNTIVLTVDGTAVSPIITQDGSGGTTISFTPAGAFASDSQHSVSVAFADNSPTPESQSFSWQFTVSEALPGDFVTVFSDGFETYKPGTLDKEPLFWQNGANGPNAAPNGSGNPWFGPMGGNGNVVGAEDGITPHSGTNMIRGNVVGDADALWVDLAYRFHGGQPIKGNCLLDWWCYDPYTSAARTAFKDYVSLYYYNNEKFPATSDWPTAWNTWTGAYSDTHPAYLFWANGIDYALEQSVTLGGSGYDETGGNYDPTQYQIRLEENRGATYGNDGWCNTSVARSAGWHHNRIVLGPPHTNGTVMVYFYIDDMATPIYSGLSTLATTGFGLLEIVTAWGDTDLAYYDDFSFALVRPPNVVATRWGTHVTLTWPGEGFTLQSSPSLSNPKWTDVTAATSGYSYDTTAGTMQFFRLRN
jgi:hypothetical protein